MGILQLTIAKTEKSKVLGVLVNGFGDLLNPWVCLVLGVTFDQASVYLDDRREWEVFPF